MHAANNNVTITVYGVGGHGALPNRAVDPILIASRIVVTLQSIVSREVNPLDPAVVTVGSIHGGTRGNIIPDEVRLQLTIRSFRDEVQDRLIAAVERIAKAEAAAGRAPREPLVEVGPRGPANTNDPALTRRLAAALSRGLGEERVAEGQPVTASEDFGELARAGVPSVTFWLGAADPAALAAATAEGRSLPGVHSPRFAPVREPTIRTGASTLALAALELLGKP
jgi:hippurate hydrolase